MYDTILDSYEENIYKAFQILFLKKPHLLSFFFDHETLSLKFPPHIIRKDALGFSSGEQLLIRIGLALWLNQGYFTFSELLYGLDSQNSEQLLKTLEFLAKK